MKVSAPFSTTRNRAKTQIAAMHGMFGYNVTIMYSTMYSEL